jgi:hypothetical protein
MKILKIMCCNDCPFFKINFYRIGNCTTLCIKNGETLSVKDTDMQIGLIKIPEWCPLEDFKQEKV